ncbi:MAG: 30S ribosomal protein S9 [Nitrososphaerota archaeon]|nr:30S ribosomal protein S9 [Nitrososphaerota archaeon]MDG6939533.1 30S ribosomal protein S9 [Nitrososphaerota archaeon]
MSTATARKPRLFSGSRKTARATAAICPGVGRVRLNGFLAEALPNELQREIVLAPLRLAGDYRFKVDIDVSCKGGGQMGQAYASAMAISRALVSYTKSSDLKKRIMDYDEHMLTGDPRQAEPKKFGGPGARRRRQKSYR